MLGLGLEWAPVQVRRRCIVKITVQRGHLQQWGLGRHRWYHRTSARMGASHHRLDAFVLQQLLHVRWQAAHIQDLRRRRMKVAVYLHAGCRSWQQVFRRPLRRREQLELLPTQDASLLNVNLIIKGQRGRRGWLYGSGLRKRIRRAARWRMPLQHHGLHTLIDLIAVGITERRQATHRRLCPRKTRNTGCRDGSRHGLSRRCPLGYSAT